MSRSGSTRLDPATMVYLDDNEEGELSLRTSEEWPTGYGSRTLAYFAIPAAQEVPVVVAGHIARHDPARVLADIAAKRAIVRMHRPVGKADGYYVMPGAIGTGAGCAICDTTTHHGEVYESDACDTLKLLAAPYADRSGYNPDWRIDA